jgi:putative SOS response-associated peptidase YedK
MAGNSDDGEEEHSFRKLMYMELASDVLCFTMANNSIFTFAGLWEQWKNPAGRLVETYSIITTTPNDLCVDVHDRMPVIFPDGWHDLWLDLDYQKTDTICDMLKPFPAKLMRRYEVSSRVNLVKHDDAACAEPVVRADEAGV